MESNIPKTRWWITCLCILMIFLFSGCSNETSEESPSAVFKRIQEEQRSRIRQARTFRERRDVAADHTTRLESLLSEIGPSPQDENSRLTAGKILLRLKRYTEARDTFAPLFSSDPPLSRPAKLGSVQALLASGEVESALALFTRIPALNKKDPDYYIIMFRLSRAASNLDTRQHYGQIFLDACQKSPWLKSQIPAAIRNLADVIKERGRGKEAIRILEQGISRVGGKRGRDTLIAYLNPLRKLGTRLTPPVPIEWLRPPSGGPETISGRPLVIEYWIPWCYSCQQLIPKLNSLCRELEKRGVGFLSCTWPSPRYGDDITPMRSVSKEEGLRLLREFLKRHQVKFPVALVDRDQIKNSGVIAYPTLYYLDDSGILKDFVVSHTHFNRFRTRLLGR